jgi:glycosyltransferase involved in cell wall biosynthesis
MPNAPRLLIVTNGHLCRNPRVVKEATTLGRAGYAVTVLHVRNHPPSDTVDLQLLATAPFRSESLDLLPGHGPRSFARRLALRGWRTAAIRLPWPTIHALGPAAALLARARALPADLTLVHNEIAHWAGLRLAATGRRVAADLEDWHSEDLLPEHRTGRPLALLRQIERQLLSVCCHTTTTSHALAAALHTRYGGAAPHVITNSFPLQSAPRTSRPGDSAPPSYFWFSQTLGPGRGIESFLSAWGRTTIPRRLVLIGEDRGSYRDSLRPLVPPDRWALITCRPLVPPDDLPATIAQHDVGLALEDRSIVSRDLTITNKILQYLNAGLAVIASDTAGQREVLARSPLAGEWVDLQDSAATARILDAFLVDRTRLAARQAAARRLAEETYSWEHEAPRLLALVANALGQRTGLPVHHVEDHSRTC